MDKEVGPVVHLVSAWNIDKARDLAWVNVETLWALRSLELLRDRYVGMLGHTVGMGSRVLLTPVGPGSLRWGQYRIGHALLGQECLLVEHVEERERRARAGALPVRWPPARR